MRWNGAQCTKQGSGPEFKWYENEGDAESFAMTSTNLLKVNVDMEESDI